MGKIQNGNFEKSLFFKAAHDYNNKTIDLHLFINYEIFHSSTRSSAKKIENFIVEATF
jgi:hypothetical protein